MIEKSFLMAVIERYCTKDTTAYRPDAFLIGDASRRKNKTWEIIGMDKALERQSKIDRLTSLVLQDGGITVAEITNGEILTANLKSLVDLDLSGNCLMHWSMIDEVVRNLPKIETLQLNRITVLAESSLLFDRNKTSAVINRAAVLHHAAITILTLNSVGLTSLWQLQGLSLPALQELHLDFNHLSCLLGPSTFDKFNPLPFQHTDDYVGKARGAFLGIQTLSTISLAGNKIESWDESGLVDVLHLIFTNVDRLLLSGNSLPNWSFDELSPIADIPSTSLLLRTSILPRISTLDISDNVTFNNVKNISSLREYAPKMVTLRATYSILYPALPELLGRLMTIASLPKLTTLNHAAVRTKERLDAELCYLQRSLSETNEELKSSLYPLTAILKEKYKNVVLSTGRPAIFSGHCMIEIKIRCEGCEDVTKLIQTNLRVDKLKTLVQLCLKKNVENWGGPIVLSFWMEGDGVVAMPTLLDNDLQTVGFYGMGQGSRCIVKVESQK